MKCDCAYCDRTGLVYWYIVISLGCHGDIITLSKTLRPRQNGRHFPDNIFKCVFLNENIWILINISLKLVPKGPINNIPTLVQIMAWRWPSDKPLSEAMVVSLLMHICVTRPQWIKIPASIAMLAQRRHWSASSRSAADVAPTLVFCRLRCYDMSAFCRSATVGIS